VVKLSHQARAATFAVTAVNERGEEIPIEVSGEHALTIYLDKRELVTLMTLGAAPELLTLGYLRNQALFERIELIDSIQVDWETESVAVTSQHRATTGESIWDSSDAASLLNQKIAHKVITTGCGQGTQFGNLIEALTALPDDANLVLNQATVYEVMNQVRNFESIYKVAGAVHGCALCDSQGKILYFNEDVGRHNAIDAVSGWMWRNNVQGADHVFYTTGRLTSEMVMKCAQMGIAFLLSRSGVTHMGYKLAEQLNLTMIGRCQGKHYLLFTGRQRFIISDAQRNDQGEIH
jgi:FdhD protein